MASACQNLQAPYLQLAVAKLLNCPASLLLRPRHAGPAEDEAEDDDEVNVIDLAADDSEGIDSDSSGGACAPAGAGKKLWEGGCCLGAAGLPPGLQASLRVHPV